MLKALVCWDQHRYLPWIGPPIIADLFARLYAAVWADLDGSQNNASLLSRQSRGHTSLWRYASAVAICKHQRLT